VTSVEALGGRPLLYTNNNSRAIFLNLFLISILLALLSDVRLDDGDAKLAGIVIPMIANFVCEKWYNGTAVTEYYWTLYGHQAKILVQDRL